MEENAKRCEGKARQDKARRSLQAISDLLGEDTTRNIINMPTSKREREVQNSLYGV